MLRDSLSGNTASSTGIDVRDKQCIDANEHRIREAVELRNANPLSRIGKLNGSDPEQVIAGHGDIFHDQVLAFARLVDVLRT